MAIWEAFKYGEFSGFFLQTFLWGPWSTFCSVIKWWNFTQKTVTGPALHILEGKVQGYLLYSNMGSQLRALARVVLCRYWFIREHVVLCIICFITLITLFGWGCEAYKEICFWFFQKVFQNFWVRFNLFSLSHSGYRV